MGRTKEMHVRAALRLARRKLPEALVAVGDLTVTPVAQVDRRALIERGAEMPEAERGS